MRLRVGVVLCLFAAYVGAGCREPLTPNIDRNQAPETWITAAPFDTITIKDRFGSPVEPLPAPGTIPVRFHVHWAGSDKDGAVVGFFWAVVETLPRPPVGQLRLPNLPGPKPADYRFTTKTDSIFIFTVAEDIPDRQHAFFIYAVDNLGKPDPTPARFIFNGRNQFPPIPVIEEARAVGRVYYFEGGFLKDSLQTRFVTDVDNRFVAPRDTVPSNSTLFFKWRADAAIPGTVVTGFRYKLDESRLVEVPSSVTSVAYNSGVGADTVPPSPGTKIFVLRAVDQSFGSRDSTRRFQYNRSPDTWFYGPRFDNMTFRRDRPRTPASTDYVPYVLLVGGRLPAGGIPGTLFSDDSVRLLPALRPDEPARRTFFEIWKDTVFARQDGDTVHHNSWIVLHGAGFDSDSKYLVHVSDLARQLPEFPAEPAPVLRPAPPNGSPVGFRSLVIQALYPTGQTSRTALTGLYPIFDPNDVFNLPRIGGYHPMLQAGRAFAVMRAEDGDGARDGRIADPLDFIQKYEAGTATPEERLLRSKVLTFHVNRAPFFKFSTDPNLFFPRTSTVDVFPSLRWEMILPAADPDPFQPLSPIGGPSSTVTLIRKITIRGKTNGFLFQDPKPYPNPNVSVDVPATITPGFYFVDIELCDCVACFEQVGSGRCATQSIEVEYRPPSPIQGSAMGARVGPGAQDPPR